MLDEILEYIGEVGWCELEKITEKMEKRNLSKLEMDIVLSFLTNYFVELNEGQRKVKLNPWLRQLINETG